MSVIQNQQAIGIFNTEKQVEAPKSFYALCNFTDDATWLVDLLQAKQFTRFQSIKSVYYNCLNCSHDVTLRSNETQQTMVFKAGKQGYRPVLVSLGMHLTITGTSGDIAQFNLLNVDMPPYEWPQTGSGGTILPGDITFAVSPRLLGRTTVGTGPGEEISVDATLTLAALALKRAPITGDVTIAGGSNASAFRVFNPTAVLGNPTGLGAVPIDIVASADGQVLQRAAGVLAFATPPVPGSNTVPLASLVNATAQYNLVGRTSAGAGAWQEKATSSDVFAMLGQANNAGIRTSLGLGTAAVANTGVSGANLTFANGNNTFSGNCIWSTIPAFNGAEYALRNTLASALGQRVAQRYFSLNSAAIDTQIALLDVAFASNTSGSENALFRCFTIQAGSLGIRFSIGSGLFSPSVADLGPETINVAGVIKTGVFTVATLPSAASVGVGPRAIVIDALGPVFGAAVVGGGAVTVPVYVDGGGWKVG